MQTGAVIRCERMLLGRIRTMQMSIYCLGVSKQCKVMLPEIIIMRIIQRDAIRRYPNNNKGMQLVCVPTVFG